jgi:hypothetical protein
MKAATIQQHEETVHSIVPRQSFLSRMKPVQGVFSKDSMLKLLLTPFGTLVNPAVIWALITLAFPVLWLVGLSLVIAQIFAGPPYSLNPTQLGYMWAGRKFCAPLLATRTDSTSAIVVGFLTSAFAGPMSDWSAKWLSRRNGGKYEPEFRLFLVSGIAVFCGLGYCLFGYLISKGVSVVAISVVFGLTLVSASSLNVLGS